MIDTFFGQKIIVYTKNKQNLIGVLSDRDQNYLYLQGEHLLIIPNNNISYMSMPNEIEQQQNYIQEQQTNILKIFVNNEMVTNIQVPSKININNANRELLNLVYENIQVQKALDGHIQKNLEYAPGEIYITTNMANTKEEVKNNESFQMSGTMKNVTENFIQPIEMVQMLQGLGKKSK